MTAEHPSVLILLVASNGEPWLRDVIAGIRKQTWDEIDVLAIDNASADASRTMLEKAFGAKRVVRLDRRVGYGRALAAGLKVAAERRMAPDALLLLHDDAAMDPATIEAMVAALGRDRVGIVGAKLVEWDEPEHLQEVGLTTDRYGRLYNPLERNELDQGQHDGLREVFYSTSACLLVAREVYERVGLFDLRYVALRDDYDLCWRARLAGWRSVVTSDARVRHAMASYRDARPGPVRARARYFSERNMIATLIKNYSLRSLVVALPVTLFASLLNVIVFLTTGRRRGARQTLSALQWNAVHLPSTLRARRRAQRRRRVRDRDVTKFMARGAPQMRSFVERALEQVVGEPAIAFEEGDERPPDERPRKRLRDHLVAHPVGVGVVVLGLLYLIGVRSLFGEGGLAGADLAPFPESPSDFFREFFSGWRSAGTGGAAPASPALFLGGVLSILSFGSVRIAERILVLSLLPLAAGAAWRLTGSLDLPPRARRAAALTYALSPLALTAFSEGRLPDLILLAALPALVIPLVRVSGLAAPGGWRSLLAGAAGLAVVGSASPWALPAVLGSGVALGAGLLAVGEGRRALRTAAAGALMAIIAAALLLPWSVELFRSGSPIGAGRGPFGAQLVDLLRLIPHRPSAIPAALAWAFPVAAAAGVLVAVAMRDRLARVLAVAGTAAVLVAWAVARGVPWIAPRPGLPLVLAALCIAVLVGLGAEGIVSALQARSFGALHMSLGALGLAVVAVLSTGVGFVARGDFARLHPTSGLVPSFFAAEQRTFGDFRVLWLEGSPRDLRADLTGPGGETILTVGARRDGGGDRYLLASLAAITTSRTEQAGRLLAPLGVRYIVLRPAADPGVVAAFGRQADIRFAQRFRGLQVLSNDVAIPIAPGIASPEWIAAAGTPEVRAAAAAAGVPLDPGRAGALRRIRPGLFVGTAAPEARGVLLAEERSERWRLRSGTAVVVEPTRSFGWANAFALPLQQQPAARPVLLAWTGQGAHRLALGAQALLLLVLATAVSRRAARERGER
jgi:GT2 family glycosyltransferase